MFFFEFDLTDNLTDEFVAFKNVVGSGLSV